MVVSEIGVVYEELLIRHFLQHRGPQELQRSNFEFIGKTCVITIIINFYQKVKCISTRSHLLKS